MINHSYNDACGNPAKDQAARADEKRVPFSQHTEENDSTSEHGPRRSTVWSEPDELEVWSDERCIGYGQGFDCGVALGYAVGINDTLKNLDKAKKTSNELGKDFFVNCLVQAALDRGERQASRGVSPFNCVPIVMILEALGSVAYDSHHHADDPR